MLFKVPILGTLSLPLYTHFLGYLHSKSMLQLSPLSNNGRPQNLDRILVLTIAYRMASGKLINFNLFTHI